MTAGELALVIATVLCVLGFTALVVALVFVIRSLGELRAAVEQLTAETQPLLAELRTSVDEARGDLDRFDKVLGSAEAISTSVEGAVAGGAGRAVGAGDQDGRDRVGNLPRGTAVAEATVKRVVWFTAGAAAGVAGTTWTQRKVKHVAAAAKPRAVATKAANTGARRRT